MKREIIVTADHSKTLLIPGLNETYHSVNGAAQEARHIFIANGLAQIAQDQPIRIFEMGFGTGLNALLSLNHAQNTPIYIAYDSVEKYPLPIEEVTPLQHPLNAGMPYLEQAFENLHTAPWNKPVEIDPYFTVQKLTGDIHSVQLPAGWYDLIFYDAFGPKVQPDLWATPVLLKMFEALKEGGRLVTYCAQGQFKRNLREAGFKVERRPGPPGKREMTVAFR